jgi:hypothetical protein
LGGDFANGCHHIVSNLAMDEGRRVYFNEIDKMGVGEVKAGGRQTN